MKHATLVLLCLVLSMVAGNILSAQNRIVAAPDAVELRKVWQKTGRDLRVDEYGTAMWGGIDISGDGIADFAVYQATGSHPNTWHFYRGGEAPDTAAFWRLDSMSRLSSFIGDFFGKQKYSIVMLDSYREATDTIIWDFDRVRIYGIEEDTVLTEVQLSIDYGSLDPPLQRYYNNIYILDINKDKIDDLAFSITSLRRADASTTLDDRAQLWIYLGGPDFRIDTPSVIVYDTLLDGTTPGPDWSVELVDIDGDGAIDMLSNGGFPDFLTRFRWGDQNSPLSWTQRPPDRDLRRGDPDIGLRARSSTPHYQIDADPGADFVGIIANPDGTGTAYIYLSSQGSPRTRSFTFEDADSVFILPERFSYSESTGFLNDSHQRVEMLPFERSEFFGDPGSLIFLSGGRYGPDADYEAYISPSRRGWALGDVTGDGWGDYGASDPEYGVLGASTGIAVIYAGGPYIPLDDTTLSVREEPVAGESGGLYLWPNPVVNELHIAWRGDLARMPARFDVYDAGGRLVVSGEVEPGRGKALWQCAEVPSGVYILQILDADGRQLSTAEVIKQ